MGASSLNDNSGSALKSHRNPTPDPHRPILVAIATLELLLAAPALGQSHATIPGSTLETLRGVTDPNAMNEAWQTALMAAAFDSDEKLVKDLIERKANLNVGNRFGMTALMYARGLPTVKLLLTAGASVNDKNITGKTALYYAAQQADPDVVRALIKADADVNAKDDQGMSALQLANLELHADQDLRDACPCFIVSYNDIIGAGRRCK